MIWLLLAHLVAAVSAPTLVRGLGRNAFFLLAAVPASAAVWAGANTRAIFSTPIERVYRWVPSLDLDIAFRIDVLSWLMMLIVGGVGALVLIYSARYFSRDASSLGRFLGFFVGFAGAMLGVVMADQTMVVYLFWELTSVLSFLLIGFHFGRRPARAAARQAILVTGLGALAMFGGLVMVGSMPGGSYRISTLIQSLQDGSIDAHSPVVIVAALLILWGAVSKSAQAPFHFWLPGAMAAPTPVSAYLHAAAMVKAGVYLIARLTPGFALIPGWSQVAVAFGLTTMIIGAYRALKQRDLKLVLAYGTVSQLGLMTAAVGLGSASALAAGVVILLAHSLFKSALFLTVGAVEHSTGTRDLWDLSGLWRQKPVLATFAGLAALSMAGVPVTAGYLGKEGLITALYRGTDAPWLTTAAGTANGLGITFLVIVILGSTLTAAYAWRFWWGAFGTKEVDNPAVAHPLSPVMQAPIAILASGALLGLAAPSLNLLGEKITAGMPGHAHIALWSGPIPALLTALILLGGVLLAVFRPAVFRFQQAIKFPFSAIRTYAASIRELELGSAFVTSRLQRGSLFFELATIFTSFVVVAGWALLQSPRPEQAPNFADNWRQVGIVALALIAIYITLTAQKRLKAALALGTVGFIVSLLFASYGAPDLALTQMSVEAVSVVVFVLVLRKLPTHFSTRPLKSTRVIQVLVAVGVGIVTTVGGYYAIWSRTHPTVSEGMPAAALNFGEGKNIVNVILVDIRAWDTVGELSVLLVTATGVASLIYILSRTGKISRLSSKQAPGSFLPGVAALERSERSVVLEVSTRLLFPTMIMLSLWLLLVGHNNPGGGFAGGVLAGLAFVLRYLAGGRHELGEAMPIPAGYLLGSGLFIAAAGGVLPLLYGGAVLQSVPVHVGFGPLGTFHFTTAMVLDIGVYLLVLGLVIDLVSALGAEVDRQSERDRRGRQPAPATPVPAVREQLAKKSVAARVAADNVSQGGEE